MHHAQKARWPQSHLEGLASFFLSLELSELRVRPNGERILLVYQARVRRDWHDALKKGDGYNIAMINSALLRSIAEEVWDLVQAETQKR